MPTLEIDALVKKYGDVRALDNMTFSVRDGEIYGFVGSNGAGKSTTMRIALGVLSSDSGEVRFNGVPMNEDLRRRIGYMPEERGLYAKEPILDQLVFLGSLHGMEKNAARTSALALLEQLGLGERTKDKLSELSLGNQQRVQLAASLIHDPDLLILDEPFSGLDPVAVKMMSDMLVERAQRGVPVLFSSHQLDLVQRLCDRVGIVSHGRMVAEGTVDELRSRGPLRYEVLIDASVPTPAHTWAPPGTTVIEDSAGRVVLEATSSNVDQDILRAALGVGAVRSFSRLVPNLDELFREVIEN